MSIKPLKLEAAITVISAGDRIFESTATNAASVLLSRASAHETVDHIELRIAAGKVLLEAFVDLGKRVAELEKRPPAHITRVYRQDGVGP